MTRGTDKLKKHRLLKMKLFLTGATGFLGQALTRRFISKDIDLVLLVRKHSAKISDKAEQIVDELSDFINNPLVARKALNIDTVIHTAARAHVMDDEVPDPYTEYRKVNTEATLALAWLAANAGVKRFVFVSSIKVNGETTQEGSAFTEDVVVVPTDPYGLSKYEAEQGLLTIGEQTGMEVVIIRPPLIYGPGVKGNFANMIKWVKKGIPLPLGAVHNKRSLVAVDNLVDFIALCADRERSPNAANQVFLMADSDDVSTTTLLQKVAHAQGLSPRLVPIPVGLMRLVARLLGKNDVIERLFCNLQIDSSKAQELLGWQPITTMDQQLQKMFQDDNK